MGGWVNGGWDVFSFASNPASLKHFGWYNVVSDYTADPSGVADSQPACQNAMNAAGLIGAVVFFPPNQAGLSTGAIYKLLSPLRFIKESTTTAVLGPSLVAAYKASGASSDIGQYGAVKLTAGAGFPTGEYLIDYIGSLTTLNCAIVGYTIEGLAIEANATAAGIRQVNHESCTMRNLTINGAHVPTPADNSGTPTGAVAYVRQNSFDASYNNVLDHVYTFGAAQDGFHLDETASSSIIATTCCSVQSGRYGYILGDMTTCTSCDSSDSNTADYYLVGGTMVACTEAFAAAGPNAGNSILLSNPFGATSRSSEVLGGYFRGTNFNGLSEANAAMLNVVASALAKATITGATFLAGGKTSDWIYVGAGATGQVLLSACDFNPIFQPLTNKYNLNSTAILRIRDCPGLNPFGTQVIAVPATGVATAALPFDATFYVTAATGGCTCVVSGGPSVVIPAGQICAVYVPAPQTLTPTFTNAPTWVVEGL